MKNDSRYPFASSPAIPSVPSSLSFLSSLSFSPKEMEFTESLLRKIAEQGSEAERRELVRSTAAEIRGMFKIRRELCVRAIAEAAEQEALWTSLLNELSNASILDYRPAGENETSLVAEMHDVPSVPQLLRPVKAWIAAAESEMLSRLLQDFPGETISSAVASHAQKWSAELLGELFEALSPKGIILLVRNEELKTEQAEIVLEKLLDGIFAGHYQAGPLGLILRSLSERKFAAKQETLQKAQGELFRKKELSRQEINASQVQTGLLFLYLAERPELTEEELISMFAPWFEAGSTFFPPDDVVVALIKHPSAGAKVHGMINSSPMGKLWVGEHLAQDPESSEESIRMAYEWARNHPAHWGVIGAHPNAPVEIIREILTQSRKSGTYDQISGSERALSDARVRELLSKSRSLVVQYRVLNYLLDHGLGEDEIAPALLRAIVKKNANLGVDLLNKEGAEKVQLTQADTLSLLQHEQPGMREAAMRLVGRVRQQEEREEREEIEKREGIEERKESENSRHAPREGAESIKVNAATTGKQSGRSRS